MALAATIALASASQAQTLNVYNVTWNATDATQNIQNAITNAVSPARVILEYHPTPWYVSDTIWLDNAGVELWVKGGATVEAKQGSFTQVKPLFQIAASNVTMRGYANFSDDSGGIATLRMRKADYTTQGYTLGQSRHCISIRSRPPAEDPDSNPTLNNIVVKGFNLEDSGGDGVCINKAAGTAVAPYNVVIKDVICDNNYRQGMSVICVDKLTVTNCVFKNTGGHAPQAGLDIEPSVAWDVLKDITFTNCVFSNNAGNNVEINLDKLHGSSLDPVDITFNSCVIDGGPKNGMGFFALDPVDGPTGTIEISSMTIKNMTMSGMLFGRWGSADQLSMTVSNTYIMDCNPAGTKSLIYFSQETSPAYQIGDIAFTGDCHIHDTATERTVATIRATQNVRDAQPKDITGTITVHSHPDTTTALLNMGNDTINCTLSVYEIP